jgi:hypothetical protein
VGLLDRAAIGFLAVAGRIVRRGTLDLASEKLRSDKRFKLAMRRHRQPKDGCQRKQEVSKALHEPIDNRRTGFVQTNLVRAVGFAESMLTR